MLSLKVLSHTFDKVEWDSGEDPEFLEAFLQAEELQNINESLGL